MKKDLLLKIGGGGVIVIEAIIILFFVKQNFSLSQKALLLESQLKQTKQDLQQISVSLKESKDHASYLESRNRDLLAKLSEKDARLESLENQLDIYKKIQNSLSSIENMLSGNIRGTNKNLNTLQDEFKRTEEVLSRNFDKVLSELKEIKKTILKGGVNLGQIVVQKPKNILEGKILSVDNEYRLAVINLGKNNKLKEGQKFAVYRGNKFIGTLKIKEIYPFMSLCEIESSSVSLRSEDKIVLRQEF